MSVISDDIGSFPVPENVNVEKMHRIAFDIATGKSSGGEKEKFNQIVRGIMTMKVDAGIMRPNYPQLQDMIESFFKLIENFHEEKEPWVVKKKFAVIPEIPALDSFAKEYFESTGNPLELRVCITGPLEIYLKKVGNNIQGDLILNIAKSISRFIENSILNKPYIKTKVICIDEPSLGLNPNVIADEEDLINSWEVSTETAGKLDVQIHLHSANSVDRVHDVKNINIIGIESAEDPRILGSIDKKELESHDKFLRVGISRTNIYSLISKFNETFNMDLWSEKKFSRLERIENKEIIKKRLMKAHRIFDDRIRYAGPDCGLGAWPDQETAFGLLKNTSMAIDEFNKNNNKC